MTMKPALSLLKVIPLTLSFYLPPAQALVDYSEPTAPASSAAPAAAPRAMAPAIRSESNVTQNSGSSGMFEIALGYEAVSVKNQNKSGDASLLKVDSHFQTPYSFFLDLSFWRLNSLSSDVTENAKADNGNPQVKLGFNWLQFGKGFDATTIDLYGAYSFKASNEVGSSRDDKIVGIETAKRFYDFAVALGFEYRLTGSPNDATEMDVGNIQKIAASLGWMVSHDIQFIVEGAAVKIMDASDESYGLREKVSYSYVAPAIRLGVSPYVNLELGALFRTQKPESREDLMAARLWSLNGVYGNSIHAALRVDI